MLAGELAILKRSLFFRGVYPSRIEAMAGEAARLTFPRKAELVRQGDASTYLMFILDGAVKLRSLKANGAQTMRGFASVGDVVACASVFRNRPYSESAIAIEPTVVLRWSTTYVLETFREVPDLILNAFAVVGDHSDELVQRIEDIVQGSVEQRLSRILIRFSKRDGGNRSDVYMTRRDLADFCGTTLFTVSRILQRWERAGIVRSTRERVTVLQADQMQRLIHQQSVV
ncbi:Crp/Fnr family transcriptional regulator [Bradyrhizobium sp. RDI18]|uniref:Crp/Fnr family transcriptional regulator n=1 Tax=Bradyrhizobium sp. RDI18 TaxID=3367400 RepID=UPI003722B152